jgi:transcriptional regulator with XRE-family HTH domain
MAKGVGADMARTDHSSTDPADRQGAAAAFSTRLAGAVARLRAARGWTLDQLAAQSGVSRAALSRLENGEVSPSAEVLARLAGAYGLGVSQLVALAEQRIDPVLRRADQPVLRDGEDGSSCRFVSPPLAGLRAALTELRLPAGSRFDRDAPEIAGQELHLWVLSGQVTVVLEGARYDLLPGDALRTRQHGGLSLHSGPEALAKILLLRVAP